MQSKGDGPEHEVQSMKHPEQVSVTGLSVSPAGQVGLIQVSPASTEPSVSLQEAQSFLKGPLHVAQSEWQGRQERVARSP